MKIIVAGMHRSGTTWLYNTVRVGALMAGYSGHAAFGTEYDPDAPADVHVQKTHNYRPPNGATVVMMYRDLRGVAASAVRMGLCSEGEVLSWLERTVEKEDKPYRKIAALRLSFEWMMLAKVAATSEVLQAVGFDAAPKRVRRAVERLELPEQGMDHETQLHAGHVTSGKVGDWSPLTANTVAEIENRHRRWLADHWYLS